MPKRLQGLWVIDKFDKVKCEVVSLGRISHFSTRTGVARLFESGGDAVPLSPLKFFPDFSTNATPEGITMLVSVAGYIAGGVSRLKIIK